MSLCTQLNSAWTWTHSHLCWGREGSNTGLKTIQRLWCLKKIEILELTEEQNIVLMHSTYKLQVKLQDSCRSSLVLQ